MKRVKEEKEIMKDKARKKEEKGKWWQVKLW